MAGLEVDQLRKAYGATVALDGCSFTVGVGEVFGFVGSNGAGKTTAMRIMLGVLAADSGHVRWNGEPLDAQVRRRIGYMPEERGLYPKMPVGEQLTYLARLHGMPKDVAVAAMEHWTERLGVSERRSDPVLKLSLGNQQRVQLAAALVHNPAILVLDEPFSGLDPVAVDVMSAVLRERADAGVPVVFSSHQLELVERLCDRVGIIRGGRIEALGTVDELRTTDRPRWHIGFDGDIAVLAAWIDSVPGAHVIAAHTTSDSLVVEDDGTRAGVEQAVLKGALAKGKVREFTLVRPSLADLFRDVVSSQEVAA